MALGAANKAINSFSTVEESASTCYPQAEIFSGITYDIMPEAG
jgi:hypothetical protein